MASEVSLNTETTYEERRKLLRYNSWQTGVLAVASVIGADIFTLQYVFGKVRIFQKENFQLKLGWIFAWDCVVVLS